MDRALTAWRASKLTELACNAHSPSWIERDTVPFEDCSDVSQQMHVGGLRLTSQSPYCLVGSLSVEADIVTTRHVLLPGVSHVS